MARGVKGSGAASPPPRSAPIDAGAIKIETGAMPAMVDKSIAGSRLEAVYAAIVKMPPGSWFIVPGTEGKHERFQGTIAAISRWKRKNNAVGVSVGRAQAGGVVVRKTAAVEGEEEAAAGSGIAPQAGRPPKAQRRSEEM